MKRLHLASWHDRFIAWFIDFVLITSVITMLISYLGFLDRYHLSVINFTSHGLVLFVYWTVMEGKAGMSLGKKVMDLKVTTKEGRSIGFFTAALESFGKAFLLPLDCLGGWILLPNTRLRLFNKVSDTIVIKDEPEVVEEVEYVKEEEDI